ncbi:hypothetical protein HELRODRAFT_124255, partial [Helobdella robusta]|uniref:Thioredoxin domain-containing protein n=1 Tax=Helobdella robusta TaxID=6412 RepID=T1EH06_HELRO
MSWKTTIITLGIGFLLTAFMLYLKREKEIYMEQERTKALGRASLGGPWELVDHEGVLRGSQEFLGKWVLIYFGFTHCPDVCPDEIEKICKVVDLIEADKDVPNITPLFITVDPIRDDVKAVSDYIKEFSPKLIGFTGTIEQISKAAKAYRVYYSEGPKDGDDDYIVDHTIISYLVGPDGAFVDFYGQNKTLDDMCDSIKLHMMK